MCSMACHGSSATVLCTPITILSGRSAAQQECSLLRLRLHQVLDQHNSILGQNHYVFCHIDGTNLYNILMIYSFISSHPGVISVYFEANVTSVRAQGFNASFWVKRCGNGSSGEGVVALSECQAGAQCVNGLCQCPHGFGGPQCDRPVCPGNCGAEEGRGTCNMVCDIQCFQQNLVRVWGLKELSSRGIFQLY